MLQMFNTSWNVWLGVNKINRGRPNLNTYYSSASQSGCGSEGNYGRIFMINDIIN